ncbi:MAG: hypothetical protein QXO15_07210 [Nitrososphaerota archaeon]
MERPEVKALEQVKERITEIVKEFIHKKTDNIAVQQMFLRDLTKYIETQDLENFFGKPKNEVIDAFLNDRNKFESLMNEVLERFWRQWSEESMKIYIN